MGKIGREGQGEAMLQEGATGSGRQAGPRRQGIRRMQSHIECPKNACPVSPTNCGNAALKNKTVHPVSVTKPTNVCLKQT